jgi:hypothetical protein
MVGRVDFGAEEGKEQPGEPAAIVFLANDIKLIIVKVSDRSSVIHFYSPFLNLQKSAGHLAQRVSPRALIGLMIIWMLIKHSAVSLIGVPDLHDAIIQDSRSPMGSAIVDQQRDLNGAGRPANIAGYVIDFVPVPAGGCISVIDTQPLGLARSSAFQGI